MGRRSGIDRFALGILSSLIVSLIIWTFAVLRERWALRRMEGHWLEVIEDTPRRYSLGVLRFSFWTKRHRYDGVNYSNAGERKFSWETLKAYFDTDHMKLLYIYEVTHFSDGDTKNHGFGQILIPNPVGLGETNGYFVDAEKANSNVHQVRYFRAEKVAKDELILLDTNDEKTRKNFIVQLASKNWPAPAPTELPGSQNIRNRAAS